MECGGWRGRAHWLSLGNKMAQFCLEKTNGTSRCNLNIIVATQHTVGGVVVLVVVSAGLYFQFSIQAEFIHKLLSCTLSVPLSGA